MDLNADLGEGMDDGPILPWLTSANVACGMHAGGPLVMDGYFGNDDATRASIPLHLAANGSVEVGQETGMGRISWHWRAEFERRFTDTTMAQRYVAVYQAVCEGEERPLVEVVERSRTPTAK